MNLTVKRSLAATIGVSLLLMVGCGSESSDSSTSTKAEDTTSTTATVAKLQLDDAWARQSPMGATMGAAYLNITSPVEDTLVGVSVAPDVAKEAQVHETVMAQTNAGGNEGESTTPMKGTGGDEMMMREVGSISLPAGEMVELKPGGFHIMLIELAKPLTAGQKIKITLEFEKAGTKTVNAEVREG